MKILVIFTGGTIGSVKNKDIISTNNSSVFKLIEMYNSQNLKNVEFSTTVPYTLLSENLNGEYWNILYNTIKKNIDLYDGIIVTHGTDTLQYTSSFLSVAFDNCNIPIVVVSANYPLDDKKSNGLANFIGAVDFISSKNKNGVFVSYKNEKENIKIHKPIYILPHLPYDDCIYSIDNNYFGEIIDGIFYKNEKSYQSDPITLKINKISKISPILKITPYVGMSFPEIPNNTRAILLESYHSGTINTVDTELSDFCNLANKKNIPIFLVGSKDGFFYESKLAFEKLNIKILPPISPIFAYVMLWIEYSA